MRTTDRGSFFDVRLEPKDRVLDCPFCGFTAKLAHTWTASYWIECEGCGAQVHGEYNGGDGDRRSHLKAAASALAAWNQRVD